MLGLVTRILSARYRPSRPPSKLVAIVVPVSDRPYLTPDEEISLRHMRRFLGDYDKFLIAPKGLEFELEGFQTLHLSRKYYGSRWAHSRMLYSPLFYKRFEDYKYILMHHLDSLVFSDSLKEWCATDVDYIGAPWIPFADAPNWLSSLLTRATPLTQTGSVTSEVTVEPRVGNGGLALMRVEAVLDVLRERYRREPLKYWKERLTSIVEAVLQPFWNLPLVLRVRDRIKRIKIEEMSMNNDEFWSFHAARYSPTFRIPDWKTGLRFAFEVGPRECFELNERQLPFGCHKPEYDRAFWEPYMIKE